MGTASVAESAGSRPCSTDGVIAASTTCLVIGPAVSCSAEIGTTPVLLASPSVGL